MNLQHNLNGRAVSGHADNQAIAAKGAVKGIALTASWQRALTLAERAALLSTSETNGVHGNTTTDLAQQRIRRWRERLPFMTDALFEQRLAEAQLDGSKLAALLKREEMPLPQNEIDALQWLAQLLEAYTTRQTQAQSLSPELSNTLEDQDELPNTIQDFSAVAWPLVKQQLRRLQQGIEELAQKHGELPFASATIQEVFLTHVVKRLNLIVSRTLVLELHVARLRGSLVGNTPQERFESFQEYIRQNDAALALFDEYPVLAHQLLLYLNQTLSFFLEFLNHLCSDWPAIRAKFSQGGEPDRLETVENDFGDSHREGRSVLVLRFHSGLRLVYKPRSLAVDLHFQELLAWLNTHGATPPFRTLQILDCRDYGWSEYVSSQECNSLGEVERFYQRQGSYLALLHTLAATDFHFENLIAAGEHPVLIDLEALFHPQLVSLNLAEADQMAAHALLNSVLCVGLLPQRLQFNIQVEAIDLSGLGMPDNQLSPNPIPYWENEGTDDMHLERRRVHLASGKHRPLLNGRAMDLLEYTDAVIAGYTHMYQLLLTQRDALLGESSPLRAFMQDEVRAILRPTHTYGRLLMESFHPDMMRDAFDRDCLFDRLWSHVRRQPSLARVIAYERADLHRGDIPIFTTKPTSQHIWNSTGQPIYNYCEQSGWSLMQQHFQRMGSADLAKQLWFIRASFASLTSHVEVMDAGPEEEIQTKAEAEIVPSKKNQSQPRLQHKGAGQSRDAELKAQLLQEAVQIGDKLERLALRGDKGVAWIGLTLLRDGHWSLGPLDMDLYSGQPGIVLFLAYLGHMSGQSHYKELAQLGLEVLQQQIEQGVPFHKSIGAFSGWAGILYTLTHLGTLWNRSDLLDQAESLVSLLPNLINADQALDIISGAAGCIGGLHVLHAYRPTERVLTAIRQCADRLVATSVPMASGIGWKTLGQSLPLAGFSHGAAGIAWALLKAWQITNDPIYRDAAQKAIAYERTLYEPDTSNWLDMRHFGAKDESNSIKQKRFMTAWCHGAPGIGLARLSSLPYFESDDFESDESRRDIHNALVAVLRQQEVDHNHSLCHGALGNLELLLQATLMLEAEPWAELLHDKITDILHDANQRGWHCGVLAGVETPDLMTGLAGIGYALLRLAEPSRVPSVLLLEAPTGR